MCVKIIAIEPYIVSAPSGLFASVMIEYLRVLSAGTPEMLMCELPTSSLLNSYTEATRIYP
jgi:hypothetical protein